MEELMEILQTVRPDIDFDAEQHLVTDRLLRSFDIIAVAREIYETFDVEITAADLVPANFNSARDIYSMVQRKLDE